MEYRSVVFDMDGVILDSVGSSEQWKYDAVRRALRELNVEKEIDRKTMDAVLGDQGYRECIKKSNEIGVNPREAWSLIAEKTSLARINQVKKGNFELLPGAENVIGELHSEGIKLGIISNAPEDAVEAVIDLFDLKQYFKFYRGIKNFEDLQARKPHPNHLEMAKFELKRDPYLYVGDAESDIMAAREAKMDSAWVETGASLDVKPDYDVADLNQLVSIVVERN